MVPFWERSRFGIFTGRAGSLDVGDVGRGRWMEFVTWPLLFGSWPTKCWKRWMSMFLSWMGECVEWE